MAMIKINDWNDTLGDFSPLPAGTYLLVLTDSQQNEKGQIVLDFTVVEGQFKGRIVKKFLNTHTPEAMAMTAKIWASICKAVGTMSEDTTRLHNKYFYADVEVTENKDDPTKKYNNIKKYIATSDYESANAPQVQYAAPAPAPQVQYAAAPQPAYNQPAPQPQYQPAPAQMSAMPPAQPMPPAAGVPPWEMGK